MAIRKITPYLMLNGTAAQAILLYEKALGARVEGAMTYGDVPAAKESCEKNPENAKRIMHAALHIGDALLMLSDTEVDDPTTAPSNVHITLDFDDLADMTARFEALAAGGNVTLPLHDTFWGAKFGMITDAFGVRWMFNGELPKR